MLLDDEELLKYGINMAELKPGVIAKLREKAADYDSCTLVAAKLTWLVYQMENAPEAPVAIKEYLEDIFWYDGSQYDSLCYLSFAIRL